MKKIYKMIKEKLHCGDNLDYMKTLPTESINLIYGDILYGTGRDFGDYQDIKAERKTVEEFYIPRITEMHRLLKPNGSIYLQMDTRINHYVKIILEDVFGAQNFRNEIVWKKRQSTMNTKTNYFTKNKDHILFYVKSKDYIFNTQYRPLSFEAEKRYNKIDENGRKYQQMCLLGRGYTKEITLNFNGKQYTGEYNWTQKTLDKRIKNGYIIKENTLGNLTYRMYLDETKGVQLSDIWEDLTLAAGIKLEYETQKKIELMARIILASSNEGDVCADFFAGSGSFGVAAKRLNRNVILCDINAKAIELSKKRLQAENNLFNCI